MDTKASITIHDIARELNISASTVSRALNNNPRISKETKDRIKAKALEMGYQPNTIASNLRNQKTNTIGIVVPLINRHFFSAFISGVEEVAFAKGYNVIISQSNDLLEKEKQIVHSLFSNRVDGLIASLSMQTNEFDHYQLFSKKKIPIVFFDRVVPELEAHKIVVDDFGVGFKATEHLIEQGYKRIAHLAGPTVLHTYRDRMNGYRAALEKYNFEIDENLIIHNRLTRIDGQDAIKQLLALPQPPDAVFCGNDTSALSMIVYLKKIGVRIPEDFGIIGFSDEPFSEVVTPSISTLKQPAFDMGVKAGELLIQEIESKTRLKEHVTYTVPTELIQRESSSRKK
ncbi:LacI family DNA-binding transcriptional regulator [Mangrovibacterium diazotrophicum]|uniref:LacI family transcriptional regulator n=1 Tax=Mangrovibacterium diazotrophicum TaxID=1261403 RepID=A0A419W3A4_9BACT|nr:LacI family DNA-binding transcriptional regulator [Mangrovibacterium diazotrophicum]RKD89948.1 LacI family transcriptional regulator [Mangrovibacterium diazotrophicum]